MAMMARQCKLTRGQFNDLVDCPMERAAFEILLRENRGNQITAATVQYLAICPAG
jgi:hypothetical protein